MDTGYFVKASASSLASLVPGYLVGGISYFNVAWAGSWYHLSMADV